MVAARTPPTDTVVALEKGAPAEKNDGRETRMTCVDPERVRAQGGEAGRGGRAMAKRAARATGEASTALLFCHNDTVDALVMLLPVAPSPLVAFASNTLGGRALIALDHEERKLPGFSSMSTSYARGSAGGKSVMGRETDEKGG